MVFFRPPEESRTVRLLADGIMEVEDGLNNKTAEQAGGYYIVDVASMDEALEWAKKGRFIVGSNEVRQLVDIDI